MSQIIKLRAWDGEKMSYWSMNDLCTYAEKSEKPSALADWMRYTELYSQDGLGIYEGDILMDVADCTHVVEFDEGHFIIRHDNGTSDFIAPINKFEIVGNIYENPDLFQSKP